MEEEGLHRGLQMRHVQLIALGGIIGSCYFLGTGYTVAEIGPGVIFAYMLGGLIVYLVMLCLGELAAAIPISGSFVTYAVDFISPAWACGLGWSYWISWVAYVPSEIIAGGIIMNNFVPGVDAVWWALLFGVMITLINISSVRAFGEMEFWLTIIKISAIIGFCVLAVLILAGIIEPGNRLTGIKLIRENGGVFPKGTGVIFLTMVMTLVNFQGSEIIGLSAGETKNPDKAIPLVIRNVTVRIILLYVIPVCLLVLILPWQNAGLEESVFSLALKNYGLGWAGAVFSFVVLTAAVSCANSGMYATVRTLYALSREGMAPAVFSQVNRYHVPGNATYFSIACCWVVIIYYFLFADSILYTYLLAIAGFMGEVCWISICWSQIKFRKKLREAGYQAEDLKFAVPFFPYLSYFAIGIQIICLMVVIFNQEMRTSLYFGLPAFIVPALIYRIWPRRGRPRLVPERKEKA
ncbi:amino acid permease [Candidatus Formimonas warabiya]|uniref:Amino acid permease n=2 Tax=Formimonas warabiya TaxID=1761012 RepID=A0A3G1L154_FORW1|nr:amino acid permease [Candidatus Formimonas warabiya]